MKHLIAVYGSLRAGLHNHALLLDSKMLSLDSLQGFDMHDLGSYPGIVAGEGSVVVEVYEVDQDVLARLDRLEGHPNFYRRTPAKTVGGVNVQVYVLQDQFRASRPSRPLVPSGDWYGHLRFHEDAVKRGFIS